MSEKESVKQYHFIVLYDTQTKEWSVEPDVSMNFDNGDVWVEDENGSGEWVVNEYETPEEVAITDAISMIMRNAPSVDY
jgi:hypothetical protein